MQEGEPLPAALEGSIYQNLRNDPWDTQSEPVWGFELIDAALARGRRRAGRPTR